MVTYTKHINLNWPYVVVGLSHKVLLLVLDLFQVQPHAECKVSRHVGLVGLQLLELGSGHIVGDACWEPSIAHQRRVKRDI
jgi:hypothetical protein